LSTFTCIFAGSISEYFAAFLLEIAGRQGEPLRRIDARQCRPGRVSRKLLHGIRHAQIKAERNHAHQYQKKNRRQYCELDRRRAAFIPIERP
jgi:hypothetical protein